MCAVIAGASVFRGFTGFGFAITAVPLLSLMMPPQAAVAIAAVMQTLGGMMDFPAARFNCHWPSVKTLALGMVATSIPGALLLAFVSADMARLLVAGVCALAVVTIATGVTFRRMPGAVGTVATGAVSGLFSGMASMAGPPVIAYYLAAPVTTVQKRASMSVFFMFAAGMSCISLAYAGALGMQETKLGLFGAPVMVGGTLLGNLLFRHGSGAHRRVSLIALAVIAVATAARGLAGMFGAG